MPGGLKYCSACEAIGSRVLLMYGADALPLICDQLWFSIRMMKAVLTFASWAAAGTAAQEINRAIERGFAAFARVFRIMILRVSVFASKGRLLHFDGQRDRALHRLYVIDRRYSVFRDGPGQG